MRRFTEVLVLAAVLTASACTAKNPSFCEKDSDCADPVPVCDVDGTRGGTANACVAEADPIDAGTAGAADASSSTARVTVVVSGSGLGTVVSDPAGISCGSICEYVFEVGTTVVLSATPNEGAVFAGWSAGECSGTQPCELTVAADVVLEASFEVAQRQLTVTLGGDGDGQVTSSAPGIACAPDCDQAYAIGTRVTLTAAPSIGSGFGGWSGACAGLDLICELDIDDDVTVGAAFDESLVSLSISIVGSGAGRVVGDVGAIDCPGVCSDSYSLGETVVLTATPDSTSTFDGWTGGGCSGTGTCSALLTAASSVVALFTRITHVVSVSIAGPGGGSVTSTPSGLDCPGAACATAFVQGTSLVLSAAPDEHSVFDRWSGVCSGSAPSCSITVDAVKSATAHYEPGDWVSTGANHTCAIQNEGEVRCFGAGLFGKRGDGNGDNFGDESDDLLGTFLPTSVGGQVTRVATGADHTCVVLATGAVRCFGRGASGRLGYGGTANIGDNELPSAVGTVDVGGEVAEIAAGGQHTCAVLVDRTVRCWGANAFGQLGLGHEMPVGDDFEETPGDFPVVDVGGPVRDVTAGDRHTCALLASGEVVCWGSGAGGRLGYGNTDDIGDTEPPSFAGPVDIGGTAVQVAAGFAHTCALLDTGEVRCWGTSVLGALGTGTASIGDDELPATVGAVDLGLPAVQIAAGSNHTCALLSGGFVRCWGQGADGRLGYRTTANIGDNEAPATEDVVNLGGAATQLDAGGAHTCARLADGGFRCWGLGTFGQLGYGATDSIGTSTSNSPAAAGDVAVLIL